MSQNLRNGAGAQIETEVGLFRQALREVPDLGLDQSLFVIAGHEKDERGEPEGLVSIKRSFPKIADRIPLSFYAVFVTKRAW